VRAHAQYAGQVSDTQAVYLRAAELHSDGYRRRSGNDAQSLFYKWGNLDKRNHWALSGFVGHQQNELAYIGSTPEELSKDRRHNGNSEEDDVFTQSLTQIQNVRTLESGDVLTTSVYYNHLQGNYDFDLNNFLGLPRSEELYNYALRSHFVGAFSNYRMNFGQSRVTFGAHANHYEREHTGSERTVGELYENKGVKGELSAFGKLEQRMGDFLFLGDLQLRHTEFDYRGSVPLRGLNWTFLNPKAGLTYFPTSKTDIYYSIGSTGREPTRNDMFLGNDDLLSNEEGNPLLGSTGSERVIDHEIGMRTRGEGWSLQTNAFYLDFDDEFVLNGKLGPTELPLTESVERSYRTGLEAELLWAINQNLTVSSSATLMRSRIHDEGVSIVPVLSPAFVSNHALEYRWERLRARSDLRFQSGSYIDFANSASLGDSVVLDLSLHYDLTPVELGLHLTNITNERSYTNGYVDFGGSERYFVRAPTGVFVTATWKL
jgi:iron complex outermembrane receptor protein